VIDSVTNSRHSCLRTSNNKTLILCFLSSFLGTNVQVGY